MKKIFYALTMVLLISTSSAKAAIPVTDAANLVQSVLQYVTLYKELQNQLLILTNDMKNIEKLDINLIDDFSIRFEELYEVTGEINGLMQNLQSVEQSFQELFPDYESNPELATIAEATRKTDEWLRENTQMMKGTIKLGAKVLDDLPKTQESLDKLLASSDGAEGILQAAQTGNQIAATIAEGMMRLQAMTAQQMQAYAVQMQSEATKLQLQKQMIKKDLELIKSIKDPVPVRFK